MALKRIHFETVKSSRNGRTFYRLLCSDPAVAEFFDHWTYGLAARCSPNTVRTYSEAVKLFLAYVYAIAHIRGGLTNLILADAIDGYESYLVYGSESSDPYISAAAKLIGNRSMGGSSIRVHIAGINNFIAASESFRVSLQQLVETGYVSDVLVTTLPLTTSRHAGASVGVKRAIKDSSWLAGCLQGGVRRVPKATLVPVSKRSNVTYTDRFGGDDLVFPIDKCQALIESALCLRDKVLWSLIAASGCRISEALTIFRDDVKIDLDTPSKSRVLIIDPATRLKELSKFMGDAALSVLSHKGRKVAETYLIEPFASMFWTYLDEYIQEQRALESSKHRPVTHRFLFRNLLNGKPIPSSYQAMWERFHKAAKAVTGRGYGFHSLRHMYAYYLVNHCPNPFVPGTFGMDLAFVRDVMGHASTKTTENYARKDGFMLEATLSAMNLSRIRSTDHSVVSVQIQYLERKAEYLRRLLGEAA